jgi:AraC-like DNA-binding protein
MTFRGTALADNEVGFSIRGVDARQTIIGPTQIASLSFPEVFVTEESVALFGQDLTPPKDRYTATIPPATISRLRRLHAAVALLAETAPEILANTDAAKGIEASLTDVFFECLSVAQVRDSRKQEHRHAKIVNRLHDFARQNPEVPLGVAEVCKALRVSIRTLHTSCHMQLGVSPKQYLTLRRLHLARRALRFASPAVTSVSEIAMRYSFWELGRFAVTYRNVFGESPSQTLGARNF